MLQRLFALRDWRRKSGSSRKQISRHLDAIEDDVCSLVSEVALVSKENIMRERSSLVRLATAGRLAQAKRLKS